PDGHLRVVNDRMMEVVAADRVFDAGGILLVGEFGRMDTYHHDLVGKFFFDAAQSRNDLDAVDAAFRPEIENHHASVQAGDGKWRRHVEPLKPGARDFRCTHSRKTPPLGRYDRKR